jgi:hypothetical protein
MVRTLLGWSRTNHTTWFRDRPRFAFRMSPAQALGRRRARDPGTARAGKIAPLRSPMPAPCAGGSPVSIFYRRALCHTLGDRSWIRASCVLDLLLDGRWCATGVKQSAPGRPPSKTRYVNKRSTALQRTRWCGSHNVGQRVTLTRAHRQFDNPDPTTAAARRLGFERRRARLR